MATSQPILTSYTAAGDLSTKQFLIMKLDSTVRRVTTAAAATDKLLGILYNDPDAAGLEAQVATQGVGEVIAGGTIAIGDLITADSAGKGVAASPSAGTNNYIIGIATEAASSNERFRVQLRPQIYQGA